MGYVKGNDGIARTVLNPLEGAVGNIDLTSITTGLVSATGNITVGSGGFFVGNGSALTGVVAIANVGTATQLVNGNSNVVITANSNVTVGITGTAGVATFATTGLYVAGLMSATGNITGGNVSGGANVNATTHTGTTVSMSGNITGGNILTGGMMSSTGNATHGNVLFGSGVVSGTGNINGNVGTFTTHNGTTFSASGNVTGGNVLFGSGVVSGTGNVTGNVVTATTLNATTVSASGNITGGNLSVGTGTVSVGSIVNNNANGVGNIGSSSKYFNTVFAVATSAQYADLAENYTADAPYEPGTVVSIGGNAEVTKSLVDADNTVIGVVSTNPAYHMNAGLAGGYVVAVALTGRVPCRVTGSVKRGSAMVSNGNGTARAEESPQAGTIIGKALTSFDGEVGVIEVVIGRF